MSDQLTLHQKLIDIQQRLKVPKDKRNEYSTSKFMYRNLEAIEEAVKPMLKEHELTLTFFDDVIAVGTRVFVKATAELSDGTTSIGVSAFAQHATDKKGMDDAQLTGSCSSYARKYAAGGLFLIDETKDADSMDNSHKPKEIRDRKAESAAGPEPMGSSNLSVLDQARLDIGEELKRQGYNRPDTMVAFIHDVLGKDKIESIDEATLVANALDDNGSNNG